MIRKMAHYALCLLLTACIYGCGSTSANTEKPVRDSEEHKSQDLAKQVSDVNNASESDYVNFHDISFMLPNGWKLEEEDNGRRMFYNPSYKNVFGAVMCEDMSEYFSTSKPTEEEKRKVLIDSIREEDGSLQCEYEEGAICGLPAVFNERVYEEEANYDFKGVSFFNNTEYYSFFIAVDQAIANEDINNEYSSIINSITMNDDTSANSNGNDSATTAETESPEIKVADSFKNMKLGDIGKIDDVYVGLSYVKKSDYLPTALDNYDEIGEGNEVILGFFDFYNSSEDKKKVHPENITCYADGVLVGEVEGNYINVVCDGIKQMYSVDMDDNTQMISVQDFEVPSGWNELKFYYESECVWTVSADDVSTDEYNFTSMYAVDVERESVEEDTVIYQGDYEIVYKGVSDYTHSSVLGDEPYVIFKFTINNTGSSPIDYSTAGYKMAGYQDNYNLGESSYAIDEQIDGFSSIYNVDKIEAGMSANVYIAFDPFVSDGDLYMVYDDGYISSSVKGKIFVER